MEVEKVDSHVMKIFRRFPGSLCPWIEIFILEMACFREIAIVGECFVQ
jgi:hypothetical protein